jgi:zinc protease
MTADTVQRLDAPGLPPSWRGFFEFVLANGLRVLFAQSESSPIVELRLVVDRGFAADPDGRSGLAAFAMAMFSEGLIQVDQAQVGVALEALGALLSSQVRPDAAVVGMSALDANLGDALRIYAGALIYPEFRTEDLDVLRAKRLALIAAERLDPFELALRALSPRAYGWGHSYGRPFTGSGMESDVAAITHNDLRSYYAHHLASRRSTLVVAGPCQPAYLQAQLEAAFKGWRAAADAAVSTPMVEPAVNVPSITLVNRPGISQASLAAGIRTLARNDRHAEALIVADTILGGIFTSRLNLSLRERKGWTYGVRSSLLDARLQGFWLIRTAVRADCAAQAMEEIAGEIENLAGRSPSTLEEFSRAVDYLAARIPASYETCAQMADALAHAIIHRLPLAYLQNPGDGLRRLRPDDVTETCQRIMAAGELQWLVVGDAAELSDQLRSVKFGNVQIVESKSIEVP